MNLTTHAAQRMQQRAIPPMVVDLLVQFGCSEPAGNGTVKYYFDKVSHRRLRQYAGVLANLLKEHLDIYVMVGPDQAVITAGHRYRRIHRH